MLSNLKLLLVLILWDTRSVDVWLQASDLIVAIFIFKVIIILTILSYFHLRLWACSDCFLILMSSTFILRTFWNFILCILEIIISRITVAFFDILNRFLKIIRRVFLRSLIYLFCTFCLFKLFKGQRKVARLSVILFRLDLRF